LKNPSYWDETPPIRPFLVIAMRIPGQPFPGFVVAALLLFMGHGAIATMAQTGTSRAGVGSVVHTTWSPSPGVSRYRFQLATDRSFTDIVVDRVVTGTDFEATGLAPGSYFWRVAPLGRELGTFSVPRPIQTSTRSEQPAPESISKPT